MQEIRGADLALLWQFDETKNDRRRYIE